MDDTADPVPKSGGSNFGDTGTGTTTTTHRYRTTDRRETVTARANQEANRRDRTGHSRFASDS